MRAGPCHGTRKAHVHRTRAPAPVPKVLVVGAPPSPPRHEGGSKLAEKGVQMPKSPGTCVTPSGRQPSPLQAAPITQNATRFDLAPPMAKASKAEALHGVFWPQIRRLYKRGAPLVPMAVSTKPAIPGACDLTQIGFSGDGKLPRFTQDRPVRVAGPVRRRKRKFISELGALLGCPVGLTQFPGASGASRVSFQRQPRHVQT